MDVTRNRLRAPRRSTRAAARGRGSSVALAAVLGLAACSDFDPPAVLNRPTVLTVVADPPIVPPGSTSALSLVVVGPDGVRPTTGAVWSMAETLAGVAPLGTVEGQPDGTARYRAPDVVPPLPGGAPPLDSIQVDLTLEDGRATSTIKAVLVAGTGGPGEPARGNPTITGLTAGGAALEATATLTLPVGQPVPLEVALAPAATDQTTFAWYASVGTIEQYLSNPTSIQATEPGQGWLFVAVRDGALGTAWRGVPVEAR